MNTGLMSLLIATIVQEQVGPKDKAKRTDSSQEITDMFRFIDNLAAINDSASSQYGSGSGEDDLSQYSRNITQDSVFSGDDIDSVDDFSSETSSGSGNDSNKKQYILDQYRQQQPYMIPYQMPAMSPQPNLGQAGMGQQGTTMPGLGQQGMGIPPGQQNLDGGNIPPPPPVEINLPPDDELSIMDRIMKENHVSDQDGVPYIVNDMGEAEELFEGDIIKTKDLALAVAEMKIIEKEGLKAFDAINGGQWPNAVVPYAYSRYFNTLGRQRVQEAIADFNKYTCIRFRPRQSRDRDYVVFVHGGGCSSMIGRRGGAQQISLAQGCLVKGIVIHEMMHALGFFHEQSRRDRDNYIVIQFGNIRRGMEYNFQKYRSGHASTLGEPYDKGSVMHYGNYAFSANGRKTIYSKRNYNEVLGQRRGMSGTDIKQLNKYYSCSTGPTTPKPTSNNVTDKYQFCSRTGRSFCKYSDYAAVCRLTCCFDNRRECTSWAKFCKVQQYIKYMKTNCKKTCGYC